LLTVICQLLTNFVT